MIGITARRCLTILAITGIFSIGHLLMFWEKISSILFAFPLKMISWIKIEEKPQDFLVIDARSDIAYQNQHFFGAVSLNEDNWEGMFPQLYRMWNPRRILAVYCRKGCDSAERVALRLVEKHLTPVYLVTDDLGEPSWKK